MKKLLIKAMAVVTAVTICLICGCTKTSDSKNDSQPEEVSKSSITIQEKENLTNKKNETKTKAEKKDNKIKEKEKVKEVTEEKEKENSSFVEEVSTESIESSIEISYDDEREVEESEEEINDFSMITTSEEIAAYAAAPDTVEEEISYEEIYDDSYFTYYTSDEFYNMGIIEWGGWSWTYYSEVYMPGEDLPISGRWTDENGYVCDENNYICLASSSLPKGTIMDTPFGKMGKVYDCGCLDYIIDVYVSWY